MLRTTLLIFALMAAPAAAQESQANERAVLDAFFEAFNAHDVEAMEQYVTGDIEIVYLDEDGINGRVDGVVDMAASMRAYFLDLPSARAQIVSVMEDGPRMAVRERALWTAGNGHELSQTALSVYRFENGLITSVWYFPAARESR